MNQKIEFIKKELRTRNYPIVRTLLDDLEIELNKLEKLQTFFEEVKKLIHALGKSNMINKEEIEELIKEIK